MARVHRSHVIAPSHEPVTSSLLIEELPEIADELVFFDHVIVILVDRIEERLRVLLGLGVVDGLPGGLVVFHEDRLKLTSRDGPVVIRVYDVETFRQALLCVCLAARHPLLLLAAATPYTAAVDWDADCDW